MALMVFIISVLLHSSITDILKCSNAIKYYLNATVQVSLKVCDAVNHFRNKTSQWVINGTTWLLGD